MIRVEFSNGYSAEPIEKKNFWQVYDEYGDKYKMMRWNELQEVAGIKQDPHITAFRKAQELAEAISGDHNLFIEVLDLLMTYQLGRKQDE